MLALTLVTKMNRLHHDVLVPAWYWGAAILDGASYLLIGAQARR